MPLGVTSDVFTQLLDYHNNFILIFRHFSSAFKLAFFITRIQ